MMRTSALRDTIAQLERNLLTLTNVQLALTIHSEDRHLNRIALIAHQAISVQQAQLHRPIYAHPAIIAL